MNLGKTINNLRRKQGIKQGELAQRSNITQTYLSQIENNLKEPNLSTIKQISDALNIPLPYLFFLSMDESDIDESKREAFKIISPSVQSLVNEFFVKSNV